MADQSMTQVRNALHTYGREPRRLATPLLVVLLGVAAVGCGGPDGERETTTTGGPTKAEYIEQADAICAGIDTEALEDRYDRAADKDDYEEAAVVIREINKEVAESQAELEALVPPPADAEITGRWLESTGDQLALVRRFAEALESEDFSRIRTLTDELERIDAKADGIAQGYGFHECGNGGK